MWSLLPFSVYFQDFDFPGPDVSTDVVQEFGCITIFLVQDCSLQLVQRNAIFLMNSIFDGWEGLGRV